MNTRTKDYATLLVVLLSVLLLAGCVYNNDLSTEEREAYALRSVLEEQARLEEANADSYVRKLNAEAAVQERMALLQLDVSLTRMSDHLLMLENLETALRHTSDSIVPLGENARAAAENSWWSNVLLTGLCVAMIGLVGFVVLTSARTERKVGDLDQKLSKLMPDEEAHE